MIEGNILDLEIGNRRRQINNFQVRIAIHLSESSGGEFAFNGFYDQSVDVRIARAFFIERKGFVVLKIDVLIESGRRLLCLHHTA